MNAFSLWATLGLDSSEYEKQLEESKGKASGIGSALSSAAKIGAAAITAATGAVTAFAGSAVKVASTFDSSMSQVAATMGYTMDELNTEGSAAAQTFETLSAFAQEMGSKTAFSASQAADALNYMALAGYDAETSMTMLPNVLNLAAAGGIELAAASDMVTDAQSALGLSLDETSELVDKMAKASSKSNTSVAQLGDAILTVGGTAKTLAGGTTELSQALGLLADNGIKGAEGGTALRNLILSLSAPTDIAAKKMKELGLEVYDANGAMRPMKDIFQDLNGTLSSMTQGEQTEVLNTLFNKVDLKSANALLATSADRWDELANAIDNADGAAQAMADVQLDNLNGDITLFKSALEGLQIAIGEGLSPALREFVQFGSEGLSRLTEAFGDGGLGGAVDAFGEILSDGLAMIVSKLPEFVKMGMQLLGALGEGIIANLPVMADSALSIIMMLADSLIGSIPQMIPAVVDIVLAIADKLTDAETLTKLMDAALQIVVGIGSGLIAALPKLVEKAPVMIGNFLDAIRAQFPNIVLAGAQLIAQMLQGIGSMVAPLLQRAGEFMRGLVDTVKQKAQEFFAIGKNIVDGIWQGIKAKKEQFTQQVRNFFSGIVNGVKSFLGIHSPSTVFAGIGENMALGLGVGFDRDINAVGKDMQGAVADITNGFDTASISYDASGVARSARASRGSDDLVTALQTALDGMGVYMDGKPVGKMVTDYQRNMTRRGAMA